MGSHEPSLGRCWRSLEFRGGDRLEVGGVPSMLVLSPMKPRDRPGRGRQKGEARSGLNPGAGPGEQAEKEHMANGIRMGQRRKCSDMDGETAVSIAAGRWSNVETKGELRG